MVDTATAKYLQDNVGPVLAKAMAEMAVAQPTDGVAYLSGWLRTYAELEEAKVHRLKEEKALAEERARVQQKAAEAEAKRKAKQDEVDAVNKLRDDLMAKFQSVLDDPDQAFDDNYYGELVEVTKKLTGASACYLGLHDEEGLFKGEANETGPCIRYDYASAGAERMTDEVLPQDAGVTYGALVEKPPEEAFAEQYLWRKDAPVPVDPPAEGEEGPPQPDYYPVYIECVTDVDKVHYFHMTRLGSYLAVPLVYQSYYNEGALQEALAHEGEKKKALEEYAEKKAEYDEAMAAEAENPPAEEAAEQREPPAPPEEKELVLTGTNVKMVLCMDTLGRNEALPVEKIPELLDLCAKAAESKQAYQKRQVDNQALFQMGWGRPGYETLREEVEAAIATVTAEATEAQAEAFDSDKKALADQEAEPELKEARTLLLEKKYAYLKAHAVLLGMKEQVKEIAKWVVVTPEVMNTVNATVLLFGYTKGNIFPRRKTSASWEKLKTFINDDLFDTTKDVIEDNFEDKLAYMKEIPFPGEYDEEKAKELWPAFAVVLSLAKAICEYFEARVKEAEAAKLAEEKRAEEAAAAAAEAEGAAG